MEDQYRQENNITGGYYKLNFINEQKPKNQPESIKNKIRPISLCLYTNKKYHILEDAMTWSIGIITDNLESFEERTSDNWSGEKGKFRNKDCWFILKEIQSDYGFQNWCCLYPNVILGDINTYF